MTHVQKFTAKPVAFVKSRTQPPSAFAFQNAPLNLIHVVRSALIAMKLGLAIVKFINIDASVTRGTLVAQTRRIHTCTSTITENASKFRWGEIPVHNAKGSISHKLFSFYFEGLKFIDFIILQNCDAEEMLDFPRRMREWLFHVMKELADRQELDVKLAARISHVETELNTKWTRAAIWKWEKFHWMLKNYWFFLK